MRFSELIKVLNANGWIIVRPGSNHDLYGHPDRPGVLIPVSRHKTEDVKSGTLNSILKKAGLK